MCSFFRDDEYDDVVEYPVVKESAQKLIETGLNTLQKTLLLKKEVEVDKVNCDLEAKRHEFRERMEKCAQKQIEVQKKQQRVRNVMSFLRSINQEYIKEYVFFFVHFFQKMLTKIRSKFPFVNTCSGYLCYMYMFVVW